MSTFILLQELCCQNNNSKLISESIESSGWALGSRSKGARVGFKHICYSEEKECDTAYNTKMPSIRI